MAFCSVGLRRAACVSSAKRAGSRCCFTCPCGAGPVVCTATTDRSAPASNVILVITAPGAVAGPGSGESASQGVAAGVCTAVCLEAGDTVSASVSVLLPVVAARPGASRYSAVDGGTAAVGTLQPPQPRATVSTTLHTPKRRWERFTCLSFLLGPKRDGKHLRDNLVLCVQVLLLDDQAVVLDRNDFAIVFPHVRIKGSKVAFPIRRLN